MVNHGIKVLAQGSPPWVGTIRAIFTSSSPAFRQYQETVNSVSSADLSWASILPLDVNLKKFGGECNLPLANIIRGSLVNFLSCRVTSPQSSFVSHPGQQLTWQRQLQSCFCPWQTWTHMESLCSCAPGFLYSTLNLWDSPVLLGFSGDCSFSLGWVSLEGWAVLWFNLWRFLSDDVKRSASPKGKVNVLQAPGKWETQHIMQGHVKTHHTQGPGSRGRGEPRLPLGLEWQGDKLRTSHRAGSENMFELVLQGAWNMSFALPWKLPCKSLAPW